MGQAKIKAIAYLQNKARLLEAMDGDFLVVAKSALAIYDNFILPNSYTGGCYLITMILHRYLMTEHQIPTNAVVGYVNDGTDDIMISHAWLDYQGLKTDLTLNIVEQNGAVQPGGLLVLDQEIKAGTLRYSYHLDRTIEGMIAAQQMINDPATAPVALHKEEEHRLMLACSKNGELMDAYIAAAPPPLSYSAITASLR